MNDPRATGDAAVMHLDASTFRAKLTKLLPGYDWTVHRAAKDAKCITATGTQSSGFNRVSTIQVTHSTNDKGDWFKVRSAGFGLRAPWLYENGDTTLARAVRGLQDHYAHMAQLYRSHELAIKNARVAPDEQAAGLVPSQGGR